MGETLKVVIVDDNVLTALALGAALRSHGIDPVAICHTVADGKQAVIDQPCDVLVTDLDLGPGPSGIDLAQHVKTHQSDVGLVLLTGYENPRLHDPHIPKLPEGLVYVVKQQLSQLAELVDSIFLAKNYATGVMVPPAGKPFTLTQPQAQLLRMIAQGKSNRAIANELFMTPDSVNTAVKRLAKRLGLRQDEGLHVRVLLTQFYFHSTGHSSSREHRRPQLGP
jgi:DNA-binding NarL/FixJ family response regulator